jgi:oligopeptide transport system substrate-binding protein
VLGAPAGANGALLRQALTYATDREAICNIAGQGIPVPASGIVPPGTPGFREEQSPFPYDPEQAQKLVAKLRTTPGVSYWYVAGPAEQTIAETLQASWKTAGISTLLGPFTSSRLLRERVAQGLRSGSQLFRLSYSADYPSMDCFLSLFETTRARAGGYTFYSNTAVDDLLVEARSTTDATQRHNLYAQAEKIILGDAPVIPLYFHRDLRIISARVQGQAVDPLGLVDMWRVWVRSPRTQ